MIAYITFGNDMIHSYYNEISKMVLIIFLLPLKVSLQRSCVIVFHTLVFVLYPCVHGSTCGKFSSNKLVYSMSPWVGLFLSRSINMIFFSFQVVQEYERAVIFRLGRLLQGGSRGPGA